MKFKVGQTIIVDNIRSRHHNKRVVIVSGNSQYGDNDIFDVKDETGFVFSIGNRFMVEQGKTR